MKAEPVRIYSVYFLFLYHRGRLVASLTWRMVDRERSLLFQDGWTRAYIGVADLAGVVRASNIIK